MILDKRTSFAAEVARVPTQA